MNNHFIEVLQALFMFFLMGCFQSFFFQPYSGGEASIVAILCLILVRLERGEA